MRIFVALFLIVFSLNAKIIQIHNIDECSHYLPEDSLVIFDLDNTIMEPVQTIGSEQWFSYRINEWKKQGFSDQEALAKTIPEYVAVQKATQMKLVEPTTLGLVQKLQKKKIPVMSLTARSLALVSRTFEQLQANGIDFSKTAPVQKEIHFGENSGIYLKDGVLFSSGENKGAVFSQMLQKTGLHPRNVLMIDDKQGHLADVEKVCEQQGIVFLGLRYGFLDEKVKNFSGEIADLQLKYFRQLLTDEDAKTLSRVSLKSQSAKK